MDVSSVLGSIKNIRWDSPYRLVASAAGLASVVTLGKPPTEAVSAVADWAGLDVSKELGMVEHWFADPARRPVLIGWGLTILVVALLVAYSNHRAERIRVTRASSTAALVLGVVGETGAVSRWMAGVALIAYALLPLASLILTRRLSDDLFRLQLDLAAAFAWIVVLPAAWMLWDERGQEPVVGVKEPPPGASMPTGAAIIPRSQLAGS